MTSHLISMLKAIEGIISNDDILMKHQAHRDFMDANTKLFLMSGEFYTTLVLEIVSTLAMASGINASTAPYLFTTLMLKNIQALSDTSYSEAGLGLPMESHAKYFSTIYASIIGLSCNIDKAPFPDFLLSSLDEVASALSKYEPSVQNTRNMMTMNPGKSSHSLLGHGDQTIGITNAGGEILDDVTLASSSIMATTP